MTRAITLTNATLVLPDRVLREPLHVVEGRFAAAAPDATVIDLSGHVIYPALVNAHDHLAINNVPPLRSAGPFANSYLWAEALQPHFKEPDVVAALAVDPAVRFRQGGLKNLLGGATTVAHHDPWHAVLDESDFPVRVLRRFGWCHSLGLAPRAGEVEAGRSLGRRLVVRARRAIRRRIARVRRLIAPGSAGRELGPFGPAVVESFRATPGDQPWFIHLAEGTDDVAARELAQLGLLGCLGANTVLVHGVGLGPADVEEVIARGAAVVWCPASNLALLGRTLAPRRLFEAGRLALGTDARVSGSRDLLDELRVASAHGGLSPPELLRLVTTDGGRVLGLPDVGGLSPGQRADAIVARDRGGDPHAALLQLRRADLRAVMRDGRPAVADRDLEHWFTSCGVATIPLEVDGHQKLIDRRLASPEALAIEPRGARRDAPRGAPRDAQ